MARPRRAARVGVVVLSIKDSSEMLRADARASKRGRRGTRDRGVGSRRAGGGPVNAPLSQGPPQIQLLALPQLDSIQRTLKILDVRLQHVQNNVNNDNKERQDIDHIRRLMSENQLALTSLVTTDAR